MKAVTIVGVIFSMEGSDGYFTKGATFCTVFPKHPLNSSVATVDLKGHHGRLTRMKLVHYCLGSTLAPFVVFSPSIVPLELE